MMPLINEIYLRSNHLNLRFSNSMLLIEPWILIIRNRLALNDIELIAEGWVSRWVEPNQTAGRTGLRKSNQRKARYQHLKVMTHPTNQHAQHNWQFFFKVFFLTLFQWALRVNTMVIASGDDDPARFMQPLKMVWVWHIPGHISTAEGGWLCQLKEQGKDGQPSTTNLIKICLDKRWQPGGWKTTQTRETPPAARMTRKWICRRLPG